MAKQKSKTGKYLMSGWDVSKKLFDSFEQVTLKNKADVCVQGRMLYILDTLGGKIRYMGHAEIAPRMAKGKIRTTNHQHFENFESWINITESVEDYKKRYAHIYEMIGTGKLFYRPEDKITKYIRL
jgi:hypothetical protein